MDKLGMAKPEISIEELLDALNASAPDDDYYGQGFTFREVYEALNKLGEQNEDYRPPGENKLRAMLKAAIEAGTLAAVWVVRKDAWGTVRRRTGYKLVPTDQ